MWGHWYSCFVLLVTSSISFKTRVGRLIHTWWIHMCYLFPEIHLWCDTCWPLAGQHCSFSTYLGPGIGGALSRDLSYLRLVWAQAGRRESRMWFLKCFLLMNSNTMILFGTFLIRVYEQAFWDKQGLHGLCEPKPKPIAHDNQNDTDLFIYWKYWNHV